MSKREGNFEFDLNMLKLNNLPCNETLIKMNKNHSKTKGIFLIIDMHFLIGKNNAQ